MRYFVITNLKKIFAHELIKGSFYVFVGGMGASILNFVFNLFMIHKLSHENYGIYAALIAIIGLLSIPAQAITPTVVRFASEYITKDEVGKSKRFYKQSLFSLLVFSLIITLILIFFSAFLNSFFHLNNWIYLVSIGIFMIIVYVSVVNNAYIQSYLKFRFLSLISLVNSAGKLFFGGIFVLLGFSIFGALGGLIVGALLGFILSLSPLMAMLRQKDEVKIHTSLEEIGKYSLLAAVSMFALTSFTSSDILLVKHFFSLSDAGLYAGLSLVGKIIFYFSSPITTVMFPILMNRFHKGENMRNTLYLSILLVFIPSLFLAALYAIFPQFFISLFLGGNIYLRMSSYLSLYGVYVALFSVVNILANYFLSIQYGKALYGIGIAALLQIFGIILFHSNFLQVIIISVSVLILLCIFLSLSLIKQIKKG